MTFGVTPNAGAPPISVNLVLTSSQGNRILFRTWNEKSWKPALVAAGVLRAVPVYELSRRDMFHVLRHTYASVQLEAGESIVSLSEWLGHASPNITLDHYAHFMPSAGRRGLAAMDERLDDAPGQKVPRSPRRAHGSASTSRRCRSATSSATPPP